MTDAHAMPRRATMKDVAALAGVGLSTVSRVVAGTSGVSADKVRRVERAIAELNFTRNDFARTLRTGNTATIGVIVTRLSDPFFAQLAHAVQERAQSEGMLVLIASASDDPETATRVLQSVLSRRLDGLVVVVPEQTDVSYLQQEIGGGTPIVLVDRPMTGVIADEVIADNAAGMRLAVDHLIAQGHTRIGCLVHTIGEFTADARRDGFITAMAAHGLDADPELMPTVIEDAALIAPVLQAMLAIDDPPTAIVTTNSPTTKATLRAIRAIGATLALVGFDDLDDADLMERSVTTIAQDPANMGQHAAELLMMRIRGIDAPIRRVVLGTRLVTRA